MTPISRCIFDEKWVRDIARVRLEHLDSLGLPLAGKRVLEVGCAIGHLTHYFEGLGCEVVSTDGRISNVQENLRRHPGRSVYVADLEKSGDHTRFGTFDIIFCYGVLYHLGLPAVCLADLAPLCTEMFLLETRVNSYDNGKGNIGKERPGPANAIHGRNCRPARDWIMRTLQGHYGYAYMPYTQPDNNWFVTRWPYKGKHARAVFVGSRQPLDLDTLSPELLMIQERYHAQG